MGLQKHKARTRSEQLICSLDALTAAINRLLDRLPPEHKPELDRPKVVLLSSAP
jgi:hypothetical protein